LIKIQFSNLGKPTKLYIGLVGSEPIQRGRIEVKLNEPKFIITKQQDKGFY